MSEGSDDGRGPSLRAKRLVLQQLQAEYDREIAFIQSAPTTAAATSTMYFANAALSLYVVNTASQRPENLQSVAYILTAAAGAVFLIAVALFIGAYFGRVTKRLDDPRAQLQNFQQVEAWAKNHPEEDIECEMLERYSLYYSEAASFNMAINRKMSLQRAWATRALAASISLNLIVAAFPIVSAAIQSIRYDGG